MPGSHVEVETKLLLPDDAADPDLLDEAFATLPGVAATRVTAPVELVARYHDTVDLALLGGRLTLRRRDGGADEGWHLKLPLGDGRLEQHEPLGDADDGPPPRLLALSRSRHRDRELAVAATLTTRRRTLLLLGPAGEVLVEVAADSVLSEVSPAVVRDGCPARQRWNEVEVELVGGDADLLRATTELLLARGARPADYSSKLGRALAAAGAAPAEAAPGLADAEGAVEVLLDALAGHVARLVEQDPMVRLDQPDAVHAMRVATRRLRSLLAAFHPLLDRDLTDPLREELRWLGGVLGGPRDTEVLSERLEVRLGEAGPAGADVASGLPERLRHEVHTNEGSMATALEALAGNRYLRLLDALDTLLADPPLDGSAGRKAGTRRAAKRAYRRVERALAAVPTAAGPARDDALHEVRKATKRLRYTCETAAAVHGRKAGRLASRAEDLQELLGEHQDSTVAQEVLARAAARARAAREDTFDLGVLTGLEQAAAQQALDGLDRSVARLAKAARRWFDHP